MSQIEKFINSVRSASRSRTPQFTMPMDMAQDVINELALVLLRENELLVEINKLKENQISEVQISGGKF